MIITYYGSGFFKVTSGDTVLAFNPVGKDSKLKQSRFGADIALISTNHVDTNGIVNVTHGGREPFVIDGPGEYEIKRITVRGFLSDTEYGGATVNTVYLVLLEGIRLCYLGTLTTRKISPELVEALEYVDILFVPIGGNGTLDASKAHGLSVEIGPRIIIPMFYDTSTLNKFLREEGAEGSKPTEKLTLKKKDLEGKEGEVVVFKS